MWNLPPPPGFQGLREDLPLEKYRQNLPHWRQQGATYFVTFRLDDSLPAPKLHELRRLKEEWERQHPPPREAAQVARFARKLHHRSERWLDLGFGSCILRAPDLAHCVVTALHRGADQDYALGCYVVMPNHVHAICRPFDSDRLDLEDILQLWKGRSAYEMNRIATPRGRLWQRESYDMIVRNEEHLWRVIQYIGRNPAKLRREGFAPPLWLNPTWLNLGWRFS